MLTLTIPGRLTRDIADFPAASAAYAFARELSGEGGSTFLDGVIERDGVKVARVSYNARVWDADGVLVYCPESFGRDNGRPDLYAEGQECAFSGREPRADLVPGDLEHRIFYAGFSATRRLIRRAA